MTATLVHLAVALGCLLFLMVMVIGLSSGIPVLVVVFRALIVMCIGTVAAAVFFRFLVSVLYRFVAEQVMLQRRAASTQAAERQASTEGKRREAGAAMSEVKE